MGRKGGRRKLSGDYKFLVARHGRATKRSANAAEKAIETRERRGGEREIREQLDAAR